MTALRLAVGGALAMAAVAISCSADAHAGGASTGLPDVPTTKVLAIGSVTDKWSPDDVRAVMPGEVRETIQLYLAGKIDQWYMRKDQPGVVFVFNSSSAQEVRALLDSLPLGRTGLMTFEVVPLGPLAPLGLLVQAPISAPPK